MNSIIIEEAKITDLKDCAKISVSAWQKTYKNIIDNEYLNNLSIETRYQKFLDNYNNIPFIVAKINNVVVGFCRYTHNATCPKFPEIDSELTVLYVNPEIQNKGVGTALFNYVKKELKKQGKKYMLINCLKGNTIGKNFYQKMHGTVIGINKIEIDNKFYEELAFKFKL